MYCILFLLKPKSIVNFYENKQIKKSKEEVNYQIINSKTIPSKEAVTRYLETSKKQMPISKILLFIYIY